MNETILWESDSENPTNLVEGTAEADIAKTDPKLKLALPVVPKPLPEMIGYTQKMEAPTGYVFGLTSRDSTSKANPAFPASPASPATPDAPEDIVITRKLVTTKMREIAVSTTNEVEQDIVSLFGNDFATIYGEFLATGEVQSSKVAQYFLRYGEWKLNNKINDDFMAWIETEATLKGAVNITSYDDMEKIFGAFGELREALFKQTGKSGRTFAIVSPRIAAFLTSTVGAVSTNRGEWYEEGRKVPNGTINGYVATLGDLDIYQYNFGPDVTGGSSNTTEGVGQIFMGFSGESPNTASIYYNKYKRYIVKGGSDSYTGQSTVFYRVRDAWNANPQDTYDKSTTDTDVGADVGSKKSQYIVKATVAFTESVIS